MYHLLFTQYYYTVLLRRNRICFGNELSKHYYYLTLMLMENQKLLKRAVNTMI